MIDPAAAQAARELLAGARNVLAITHIAPDGDAIGSLTAAGHILGQLGLRFTLVCDDGLPERFRFLPLSNRVASAPDPGLVYDLILALDAGDLERLGRAYRQLRQPPPPILNVDHHVTNTFFGAVNFVGVEANSTTEMLFHLLPALDVALTKELAICLLTGLVTDTLSFRTAGVSADTLQVAGALIDAGADLFTVVTLGLNMKELSTLLMWQTGLNNLRSEDGLIWTVIGDEERMAAGHNGGSSFGLGNMLADVYGVAMSAVLMETGDGKVSVGFRCRPPYDVAELAQELGGGGHRFASGCSLPGPLAAAEARVVAACKAAIRRQRAEMAAAAG
ncbi:MAG: DHH family phosphoesterase [Candidatus Promineifilaceae bacterium]